MMPSIGVTAIVAVVVLGLLARSPMASGEQNITKYDHYFESLDPDKHYAERRPDAPPDANFTVADIEREDSERCQTAACNAVTFPECGLRRARMPGLVNLGGIKAHQGEFPFMAALQYLYTYKRKKNGNHPPVRKNAIVRNIEGNDKLEVVEEWTHSCGATLLNSRWALTAAHCVETTNFKNSMLTEGARVVLGTRDRHNESVAWRLIDRSLVHPHYVKKTLDNDIALIHLASPVEPIVFRMPKTGEPYHVVNGACLPPQESPEAANLAGKFQSEQFEAAGWGDTEGIDRSPSADGADLLRKVKLDAQSQDECTKKKPIHTSYSVVKQFCTVGTRKDVCVGDSGGPLLFEGRQRGTVQGIVSFGAQIICERPFEGAYHTKVAAYTDWITEHAKP